MDLEFLGVRGTLPYTPDRGSVFGTATPCAVVTGAHGEILIIDAGTGIHALGNRLAAAKNMSARRLSIFLTHFHLDHIQGIPFFVPLYSPRTEIVLYAAADPEEIRRNLSRLMSDPYFPFPFERTAAKKRFRNIAKKGVSIGSVRVSCASLIHPQGSAAYRFEEENGAIVFATDTEHPLSGLDPRLAAFAQGAQILVYDATYFPEEYESGKKGWGHSTWLDGTRIARAAGVRHLILSHFNPDHADRDIRRIERLSRREFPNSLCAREGLRLRLKSGSLSVLMPIEKRR